MTGRGGGGVSFSSILFPVDAWSGAELWTAVQRLEQPYCFLQRVGKARLMAVCGEDEYSEADGDDKYS